MGCCLVRRAHAVPVGTSGWVGVPHLSSGDVHGSSVYSPLVRWCLDGQLFDTPGFYLGLVLLFVRPNNSLSSGREGGWEEARVCLPWWWFAVVVRWHGCVDSVGACCMLAPGGCGRRA